MADYVTIVSGLPRSGTSLMMRMLEAGGLSVLIDQLRQPDEDNPAGYYEFEPVKGKDQAWLAEAPGKAVKMVYRLLYDLPADRAYRVLFMRRKLEEVLASQQKMLSRLGTGGGGVSDEQIARLFRSQLAQFDEWLPKQPQFRRLDVDYNALLADPAPQLAAINAFLDGRLNVAAMSAVIDPSLYRNRAT